MEISTVLFRGRDNFINKGEHLIKLITALNHTANYGCPRCFNLKSNCAAFKVWHYILADLSFKLFSSILSTSPAGE